MLERLGKYEILETVAAGGQGTVYRARDSGSGDVVALKVMHPGHTGEVQYLEALRQEANLASRLDHPNIVKVFDFQVEEGTAFVAMEYVPGVLRSEMQLLAGKEYQRKTSGPHQMWATDASYFPVVSWGYYYMVTVMDDYSRSILAWKLQLDMTSDSLIQVVQAGPQWEAFALVFTTSTGGPLSDRVVRARFYRILENAGLRRQRFHDLRHCCASLMIAQGVQSREVMETLGHSTIVMTLNRYAHIFQEALRETAKKMGEILTG